MQLKPIFTVLLTFLYLVVSGQDNNTRNESDTVVKKGPVEFDFLLHYYDQDGDHSAVTGGKGTEALQDRAITINLVAPLDTSGKLITTLSFSHYTSASTDNISAYSQASGEDTHFALDIGYNRKIGSRGLSLEGHLNVSLESDYLSRGLAFNIGKVNPESGGYHQLGVKAYLDRWVIILPEELREEQPDWLDTDKRKSFEISWSHQRYLSKRMALAASISGSLQHGLISTPFYRVYNDSLESMVEHLPDNRWKLPVSLGLNYFINSYLIMKANYRFYLDDWGVIGNTINLEFPIKARPDFTLSPFYRIHIQNGSKYFAPYAEHSSSEIYYTSDYDLSTLINHKVGLAVRYQPLGLKSTKENPCFKELSLRSAYIQRNDGLNAFIISLKLGFNF